MLIRQCSRVCRLDDFLLKKKKLVRLKSGLDFCR